MAQARASLEGLEGVEFLVAHLLIGDAALQVLSRDLHLDPLTRRRRLAMVNLRAGSIRPHPGAQPHLQQVQPQLRDDGSW